MEGRRRKCDACKARPGRVEVRVADSFTTPAGLQERGRGLWASLGLSLDTPAGQVALEACRVADRLDELDSVIAGKGVLRLMAFRLHFGEELEETGGREIHVTVGFQNVLAEARQQAATFKALLAEIKGDVKVIASLPAPAAGKPGPLDELARRRLASSQQ